MTVAQVVYDTNGAPKIQDAGSSFTKGLSTFDTDSAGFKALVRSRRPAVLRRLHAIDATRVHQTRSGVVSFLLKRPFGPRRGTTMLTQSFRTGQVFHALQHVQLR